MIGAAQSRKVATYGLVMRWTKVRDNQNRHVRSGDSASDLHGRAKRPSELLKGGDLHNLDSRSCASRRRVQVEQQPARSCHGCHRYPTGEIKALVAVQFEIRNSIAHAGVRAVGSHSRFTFMRMRFKRERLRLTRFLTRITTISGGQPTRREIT